MSYGFTEHEQALRDGHFVRVVNYHNTTDEKLLRRDLTALVDRYVPTTLTDLDEYVKTGVWRQDRPGVIPVFYEGYRNNYEVAAPVCESLGLEAFFFICTAFVDTPVDQQEAFARSHQIDLVPSEYGRDRLAMTWEEIKDLSTRHTVTPHTASHAGIADIWTDADLQREIVEPKQKMDAVTGQNSPAMAFLWGTPVGGSERHEQAVRDAGYRYIFSNTAVQVLG